MKRAVVVAGLGFGDEGKGTTVDWLVRRHDAKVVVRFNGGAQAGHNVVTPDGRHHCFSQWGSGTFAGARTYLSRFMLVNPIFALSEAKHLEAVGISDPLSLLVLNADAVVTTPFHVAANRLQEMARIGHGGIHGSCGMGIGETMADVVSGQDDIVTAAHVGDETWLCATLRRCQERKRAEVQGLPFDASSPAVARELDVLSDASVVDKTVEMYCAFANKVSFVATEAWLCAEMTKGTVVFEGAQGVLLDEWRGFHPHTTWSTCTFENALTLFDDARERSGTPPPLRLGVLRAFATRHGAGPFPTEMADGGRLVTKDHNVFTPWQHGLRVGAFDLVLSRYAIDAARGCDALVFTHLDGIQRAQVAPVCRGYEGGADLVAALSRAAAAKPDLAVQEQLGRQLGAAVAPIERVPIDVYPTAVRHVLHLAEALGVAAGLVSYGPTHRDKEEMVGYRDWLR